MSTIEHLPQTLESVANQNLTLGSWEMEQDSEAALDAILAEHSGLWKVQKEVPGTLIQPAEGQNFQSVRIDRILIPLAELLNLGWKHGAIGIECKRSGEKIGPPIAQAADYGRSIFKLHETGIRVWLNTVFIWCMGPQHGPLASMMYQQRVGSAYAYRWAKLYLKLGEESVLRIEPDGSVALGNASAARKVGSR